MKVELQNVSKRYGATRALEDFSLTLEPGRIVAVIGLNGAGKTTLLRCLAGIVAPTAGEVLFDGQRFLRRDLALRRRLMFLPDFPPLFGHMNALQHIALLLRLYERETGGIDDELIA